LQNQFRPTLSKKRVSTDYSTIFDPSTTGMAVRLGMQLMCRRPTPALLLAAISLGQEFHYTMKGAKLRVIQCNYYNSRRLYCCIHLYLPRFHALIYYLLNTTESRLTTQSGTPKHGVMLVDEAVKLQAMARQKSIPINVISPFIDSLTE
jgi:hypothetical protein